MAKIRCPNCTEIFSTGTAIAGTNVECEHCGQRLALPDNFPPPKKPRSKGSSAAPAKKQVTRKKRVQRRPEEKPISRSPAANLQQMDDDPLGLGDPSHAATTSATSQSPVFPPGQQTPSGYPGPQFQSPQYASPRRRSSGSGSKTFLMLVIVLGIGTAMLGLLVIGGIGAYYFYNNVINSPTATFERMTVAVQEGDFGKLWDTMDEETQETMSSIVEIQMRTLRRNGGGPPDMTNRQAFIYLQKKNTTPKPDKLPHVISETVDGNKAQLKIGYEDSERIFTVNMVNENGAWKLSSGRTANPFSQRF